MKSSKMFRNIGNNQGFHVYVLQKPALVYDDSNSESFIGEKLTLNPLLTLFKMEGDFLSFHCKNVDWEVSAILFYCQPVHWLYPHFK